MSGERHSNDQSDFIQNQCGSATLRINIPHVTKDEINSPRRGGGITTNMNDDRTSPSHGSSPKSIYRQNQEHIMSKTSNFELQPREGPFVESRFISPILGNRYPEEEKHAILFNMQL